MKRMLVFYPVSNAKGYDRHYFECVSAEEACKLLSELEGTKFYDMQGFDRHGRIPDMEDFVEDYNDEELDGGWWTIILELPDNYFFKKKQTYYDRCYELKKEMVGNIQEILREKGEIEVDGGFDVIVTDHHCGEAWQTSMTKLSSDGIEADGEEFALWDVELSDLCVILDNLIDGDW